MIKIIKCRSCKSKSLINVFNLGSQHLTGVFPKKKILKFQKGSLIYVCAKVVLYYNLEIVSTIMKCMEKITDTCPH